LPMGVATMNKMPIEWDMNATPRLEQPHSQRLGHIGARGGP